MEITRRQKRRENIEKKNCGNTVRRKLKDMPGMKKIGETIQNLKYAYDYVLIEQNEIGLKDLSNIIKNKNWNGKKTEATVIHRKNRTVSERYICEALCRKGPDVARATAEISSIICSKSTIPIFRTFLCQRLHQYLIFHSLKDFDDLRLLNIFLTYILHMCHV